jgi:uncharacterized damage-inducible protein DinB
MVRSAWCRRVYTAARRARNQLAWIVAAHKLTGHAKGSRTGDTPMTIGQALLPEFDQEMASTRRAIERVPSDKGPWKPHPKSFPLGHLAQLVAGMPGWLPTILQSPRLDLAGYPGYSFETTETLLGQFDANVRAARAALGSTSDAAMDESWSLVRGDQVFFTSRRGDVVRQTINHLVHHRGQLTVYLRLLDVPVPAIYGPSADEGPAI